MNVYFSHNVPFITVAVSLALTRMLFFPCGEAYQICKLPRLRSTLQRLSKLLLARCQRNDNMLCSQRYFPLSLRKHSLVGFFKNLLWQWFILAASMTRCSRVTSCTHTLRPFWQLTSTWLGKSPILDWVSHILVLSHIQTCLGRTTYSSVTGNCCDSSCWSSCFPVRVLSPYAEVQP